MITRTKLAIGTALVATGAIVAVTSLQQDQKASDTVAETTRLRPAMTAPPEVIKRMKSDPNREIRVSGDQTLYSGTAASPVLMSNLPDPATVTTVPADDGAVRVAGGAQIESPMSDAAVAAAIANAMKNAPDKGMQKLRLGSRGNSGRQDQIQLRRDRCRELLQRPGTVFGHRAAGPRYCRRPGSRDRGGQRELRHL